MIQRSDKCYERKPKQEKDLEQDEKFSPRGLFDEIIYKGC